MKGLATAALSGLTLGRVLTVAFGMALIIRCERDPAVPGGWITCWVFGGSVAGVKGLAEVAESRGFQRGFNTFNPALKRTRKDEDPTS